MEKEKKLWEFIKLFADKLLFAGLLVWLTYFFETKRDNESLKHQLENQILLKKLDSAHNVNLALVNNQHQKDILNKEQETQQALLREQLNSQYRLLERTIEQENRKIKEELKNNKILIGDNVEADKKREIDKIQLRHITSQLQEFYWPILVRLEKNNSVYRKLEDFFFGERLDEDVVLPNHLEIVNILENNLHLAEADSRFLKEISHYLGHVYMFQALRKNGFDGYPEGYGGHGYRSEFYEVVKARTNFFQTRYESLLDSISTDSLKIPIDTLYKGFEKNLLTEIKPAKLNVGKNEFDLKLAKNNEFFVHEVGRENGFTMISFQGYDKKTEEIKLKIGGFERTSSGKLRFLNSSPKDEFFIRENNVHTSELNGVYYRTHLKRIWIDRKRVKISLRVNYWDKVKEESP